MDYDRLPMDVDWSGLELDWVGYCCDNGLKGWFMLWLAVALN